MYLAAQVGDADVVRALIEQNDVNLNEQYDNGTTPVHIAAFNGHIEAIRLLAAQPGIDLNAPDRDGITPVCISALHGHLEVFRFLAKQPSVDLNKPSNHGMTPALIAAQRGHVEMLCILSAFGADLNKPNKKGVTPTMTAAFNGHLDALKFLLKPGMYLGRFYSIIEQKGHLDVLKFLIVSHCTDCLTLLKEEVETVLSNSNDLRALQELEQNLNVLQECDRLLRDLYGMDLDRDPLLRTYVVEKQEQLIECLLDNKQLKALRDELESTRYGIQSHEVVAVKTVIARLRVKSRDFFSFNFLFGFFFSYGLQEKAARVEQALYQIPPAEREHAITSQKSNVLKDELARHRFWWKGGMVLKNPAGNILEEKAAASYRDVKRLLRGIN